MLSFNVALAQSWPTGPVKWILPASAGGNSDILARILIERLRPILGQPVILDYRAGAAGRIAAEAGARTAPDGYTFFMTSSAPHGVVPAITKSLPYDPVKSFTPVARLATTPNVLYVRTESKFRSVADLTSYAKSQPSTLNFSSAGHRTTMHLSAVLLALKAGISVTHVPYKGGSEVLVGILSGNVDAAFESLPVVKPQIDAESFALLRLPARRALPSCRMSRPWPRLACQTFCRLAGMAS